MFYLFDDVSGAETLATGGGHRDGSIGNEVLRTNDENADDSPATEESEGINLLLIKLLIDFYHISSFLMASIAFFSAYRLSIYQVYRAINTRNGIDCRGF